MITVRGVDLRVAAQLLLADVSFTVGAGDRVGLVGRNGAGKTTLMKTLAGEARPASGQVAVTGSIGYLPQDPRAADPAITVTDRILSARGLDTAVRQLRAAETAMSTATGESQDKAMAAYARAEAAFQAGGGYAAEAEAARLAAGVGLPNRALEQPIGELSGGQRRRVELARILFAQHDTLLLDEPTNHLDADSVQWLRQFLLAYPGGLIVISHDRELLKATVNRVFHLDPQRLTIDIHNTGWTKYLEQLEVDERRRQRERAVAERKAAVLHAQAAKMQAGATTAVAARNMARRADKLLSDLEPVRRAARVAKIRLPAPAPSGRTPLSAVGLKKSYGALQVLDGVDLAVDRATCSTMLPFPPCVTRRSALLCASDALSSAVPIDSSSPASSTKLSCSCAARFAISCALTFWRSMRQRYAIVRSVASSVVGVTIVTLRAIAQVWSSGSWRSASLNAASTGTNISTKSSVRRPSRPA
jgi:ATPase subunit of ABC transporter with duplicated ATPase domains